MRLFWIVLATLAVGLILLVVNDGGEVLGLPTDQFGEAFYLGVLGMVIAAGVVGSGMRFGQVARSLAIWALVILALVTGYQYRYELQDVASRLTAGLVPGSPIALRDADGANLVQLDKMGDRHFGARGAVDGRTVAFLVDTGASATVLTTPDARMAGFDVDALRFDIPVSTANGVGRAARVTVGELRIASIVRGPMPVLVAEDGMLGQSLLGMDFIGTLSGFDVRGDRMTLRD